MTEREILVCMGCGALVFDSECRCEELADDVCDVNVEPRVRVVGKPAAGLSPRVTVTVTWA